MKNKTTLRPSTPLPQPNQTDAGVRLATWAARVLDDWYLDPIIGFVLPGLGDAVGAVLGLFIVLVAIKRRVSVAVIARMLINLAVDALLGSVPLVGDLFDAVSKANRRNLALLTSRQAHAPARVTDWLFVSAAVLLFVLAITVPLGVFIWLVAECFKHV